MTTTTTYPASGGAVVWTVPAGVTSISVDLRGGQGGGEDATHGKGGRYAGTYTVVPGTVLRFEPGAMGGNPAGNVGGLGGASVASPGGRGGDGGGGGSAGGYGGGGASGFSQQVLGGAWHAVAYAGGGGGRGRGPTAPHGGHGGDSTASDPGFIGDATTAAGAASSSSGGAGGTGLNNGTSGAGIVAGHGGTFLTAGLVGAGGGGGGKEAGGAGGGVSAGNSSGGGSGGVNGDGPFGLHLTTVTADTKGYQLNDGEVIVTYNQPPNQPSLSTPPTNTYIDVALTTRFSWAFSDPDPTDTQSRADARFRIGVGAWAEFDSISTTDPFFDTPPNNFLASLNQLMEWQVRTWDTSPTAGPWSSSFFFTPVNAPAAPTISPTPVIDSDTPSVSFSTGGAPIQVYQARVVNDVAGSPGATVYADTGVIAPSPVGVTSLSITMPFFAYVNGTSYHVEVRYQKQIGAWSPWADSGPIVADINAPLQPTLVVTPDSPAASILVEITNPGGDPFPPTSNDLYRTDLSNVGDEIRIATNIPVNGAYNDVTPGSNTVYRYRAVAIGTGGAFTSSA